MDTLTVVQSLLECSLCLESFNDPRILPCGHTFCLLCLQRFVAVKNATHHSCSICRVPWATPKDGIDALPKNFVAKSIVSLPPPVPLSSDTTMMCPVHEEQKIQIYCRTCEQLTCMRCVIKCHQYHELNETAEADKLFIDKLTDCRRNVQTTHTEWSQEFDRLEARTTLLKQRKIEATKNFDDSVHDVEKQLRAAFDSLICELRQQKSARCNAFEEQLDQEIQHTEKAKEVVASKLQTCSQNMLAIDKALSATIQDRCEYVSKQLPTTTCERPTTKLTVMPSEATSLQTFDIWKTDLVAWQQKAVKTMTELTTTIAGNLSATPRDRLPPRDDRRRDNRDRLQARDDRAITVITSIRDDHDRPYGREDRDRPSGRNTDESWRMDESSRRGDDRRSGGGRDDDGWRRGGEEKRDDKGARDVRVTALKVADNQIIKTMGVDVETIREGDGKTFPKTGNKVIVHFTGTLLNGRKFDSSKDRGKPFEFIIGKGEVIRGWDEGVAQMSKGQIANLICSPDFAYGSKGAGGIIPPNTTLIFEVELIDIK